MEAIKTYIDNVFSAYPQNVRVMKLKNEMLASMEEKYHELKSQGKSENEAIGSVIANFGNMDEIIGELGIEAASTSENTISLTAEEVGEYMTQSRKSSFWVGVGVWLILASISAMILVSGSTYGDFEGATVLILFVALAVAVPLFIKSGMNSSRFEHYTRQKIVLPASLKADLEEQSKRFGSRFFTMISVGVGAIILAVGVVAVSQNTSSISFGFPVFISIGGESAWEPAMLLAVIGFSVFLFVTASSRKGVYDVLLGKGEYADKRATNDTERAIGGLAAVYWPAVTAVYLAWSFIGDAWDRSWIVWPVAGVLFGALYGLIYWIQQSKKSKH